MADTAILLEIITYIFQRTPPTVDCDEPLTTLFRFDVLQISRDNKDDSVVLISSDYLETIFLIFPI